MKEVYIIMMLMEYKIIEIYNPVTKECEVILFNEFNPDDSERYFYVTGIDITEFLKSNMATTRDNMVSFKTTFTAYMQKSKAVNIKYCNQFLYKLIS